MKNVVSGIVKKISQKDINIKKNYKKIRTFQKIINMPSFKYKNYEDVVFELKNRSIKTRVFNSSVNVNGMIIFIHGGGWVLGDNESYTNVCAEISKKTNRLLVSIDYRLAPEYPYPNGLNDCYEIINIIMKNIYRIGFKSRDVCLIGDSAGANLVAAVCIKAKKTKDFKISKQILLYPAVQSDYSKTTKYKSVIEKGKDYLLTQNLLQDYISLYVDNPKYLNNPLVSPIKVRFPFGYPKTLIITADNDPLRDEGRLYARKLKFYLNNVEYYNVKDAMHGFLSNPLEKKAKDFAYQKIIEFLGDENEGKK